MMTDETMPLWSPEDPYGIATLRKVLLTLSAFLVLFGGYRALVRADPYPPYVIAAVVLLLTGLFLERGIALVRRDER